MIGVGSGLEVLVATKPVDFRRGAESLASLAKSMGHDIAMPGTDPPVWTAPPVQEESLSNIVARGRVRTCVRPQLSRLMPAGPNGVR